MNREAFEQALRVLDGVKKEEFKMDCWWEIQECKTTGCVIGHCVQDSWFKEKGLTLRDGEPFYKKKMNFEAIASFFDLSHYNAKDLFHIKITGNDLESVKDRLRTYMEEKEEEKQK